MITKKQIRNSLLKVGLKKNMTLLMSSSLISLGRMDIKDYYKTFFDEIIKIIGKKGTLCINSYSTQIVREGGIYLGKKTPSNAGGFENFLKRLKSSVTSDHPAHSVTAIGHYSKFICNNNGLNNFDLNSPYFKMLNLKTKILRIGIDYDSNSFTHVAEALCGVPYFYCKWIKIKTKKKFKNYSMYVRHLGYNLEFDNKRLKCDLDSNKKVKIKSSNLGLGKVHLLDANEYFEYIKKNYLKTALFTQKKTKLQKGRIPFDGLSKGKDGVV